MRISCLIIANLLAAVLAFGGSASADSLQDANRLLRVTDAGKQFESVALLQTRSIIRTYSSIVSMSADSILPAQIKQTIAACYAQVYAWENFKPGIAKILADNFSQKEMRLLIDFYRNRGLPPMEIQSFKAAIAKGGLIQKMSAEYIFANSEGCVELDAELILGFLDQQKPNLAAE